MNPGITVETITEDCAGCYLDGSRGHYGIRDMVELAIGYGYIVDGFVSFALGAYDDQSSDEGYPHEELVSVSDSALDWLNGGPNTGYARRTPGQNSPPVIPYGYGWQWLDGDFGLYSYAVDCED